MKLAVTQAAEGTFCSLCQQGIGIAYLILLLIGYDYIRSFGRDRSVGQTVVIKVEQGGNIGVRTTDSSVNCFCRAFPWPENRPMHAMTLFSGDTPVDSSTHVWLMTIGLVAYFIPRR